MLLLLFVALSFFPSFTLADQCPQNIDNDACYVELYSGQNYGGQRVERWCSPGTVVGSDDMWDAWVSSYKVKPGCTFSFVLFDDPDSVYTRNTDSPNMAVDTDIIQEGGHHRNAMEKITKLVKVEDNPCQLPSNGQTWVGYQNGQCYTYAADFLENHNKYEWESNHYLCDYAPLSTSWDLLAINVCPECGSCAEVEVPAVPVMDRSECVDQAPSAWVDADGRPCVDYAEHTDLHWQCTHNKGTNGLFAFDACPYSCKKSPCDSFASAKEWEHFDLLQKKRAEGWFCGSGDNLVTYEPNPTPLVFDCKLWRNARNFSRYMADTPFFAHEDPEGRRMEQRAEEFGTTVAGENLSGGRYYANETLEALHASYFHCKNMMKPSYTRFAVGLQFNPDNQYGFLWTQLFDNYDASEMNDVDTSCYPLTQPDWNQVLPKKHCRAHFQGEECLTPPVCPDGSLAPKVDDDRDCCGSLSACPNSDGGSSSDNDDADGVTPEPTFSEMETTPYPTPSGQADVPTASGSNDWPTMSTIGGDYDDYYGSDYTDGEVDMEDGSVPTTGGSDDDEVDAESAEGNLDQGEVEFPPATGQSVSQQSGSEANNMEKEDSSSSSDGVSLESMLVALALVLSMVGGIVVCWCTKPWQVFHSQHWEASDKIDIV